MRRSQANPWQAPRTRWVVTSIPWRFATASRGSCLRVLSERQEDSHGSVRASGVPFDRLVEDLNLTRDVSRSPLVDVMLILQSVDRSEPAGDLRVRSFFQQQDTTVLIW